MADKKSVEDFPTLQSPYLVNGIPMDDISGIPTDMIKSLDVQDDVIVITTKDISDYIISEENMLSQTLTCLTPSRAMEGNRV